MNEMQTDRPMRPMGALVKWGSVGMLTIVLLSGSYLGAYSATATSTLEAMDCTPHRTYHLGATQLPRWCDGFFRPADWLNDQMPQGPWKRSL